MNDDRQASSHENLSLCRALDILENFKDEPDRAQIIGEVAGRVGLPVATCARLLVTLEKRGYVERVGSRKGYCLGPMAYELVSAGPYRRELVRAAEPLVASLAQKLREQLMLVTISQGRRVVLCEVEADRPVRVSASYITNSNFYSNVTARIMLAALTPEAREEVLRLHGPVNEYWPEAATAAGLAAELERIKADGYFAQVFNDGVAKVGAGVVHNGQIAAALCAILPAERFNGEHAEAVKSGVRECAAEIAIRA